MMLTASESLDDQDEAEMLGSIYFLHKPVTEKAVTTAVLSLGLWLRFSSDTIERFVERQLQRT